VFLGRYFGIRLVSALVVRQMYDVGKLASPVSYDLMVLGDS
jgi:hypothetical protein